MLLNIDESFTGAGVKPFRTNFRWLKVLTAPSGLTIRWGKNGPDNEWSAMNAGEGFRARPGDDDFGYLSIQSAGVQTIRVQIGDQETFSDRVLGAVTISGDLGAVEQQALGGDNRLLTIAAGSLGDLIQQAIGGVNAQVVTERGYAPGANFCSTTVLAGSTNEQVFSAASNANGALIHRVGASTGTLAASNVPQIALLAKATAPASGIDGEMIFGLYSWMSGTVSGMASQNAYLERPRYVAAGKGLWFRNSGNLEGVCQRFVDYTLL